MRRDTLETNLPDVGDGGEQREKRVRRRLMVGITAPRKGQVSGYTNNLAVHGFSVGGIHRTFDVGTLVKVILQLPDQERASIEGEVVWVRRGMDGGP
ncbi:MAG: PilZ domain-containing protein, partial [Myxococcales bacterium]